MEKGQTIGEPTSTVFSFTRDGSKLTADARLLGTMGAVQDAGAGHRLLPMADAHSARRST